MEFVQCDEQEYMAFRKKHPCRDILNSKEAMDVKRENHWKIEYVGIKENGELLCATPIALIPVMKIFLFAYAQRGFLINYEDKELLKFFTVNIQRYLHKKRCLYLLVDPNVLYIQRDIEANIVHNGFHNLFAIDNMVENGYQHQGFVNDYQVLSEVRWMFAIYLKEENEDSLLKKMKQRTRYTIHKTEKIGIEVRQLLLSEIDVFLDMMHQTSQRRGFHQREDAFYKKQMTIYGDKGKLLLAELHMDVYIKRLQQLEEELLNEQQMILTELNKNPSSRKFQKKKIESDTAMKVNIDKQQEAKLLKEQHGEIIPLASAYFVQDEDELIYLYSAAYESYLKFDAPYAIQWFMLQYALNNGIEKYNFYGLSGNFEKDTQDYGVYHFKRGFSGVVEELVGDFILPIRPASYRLYKWLKQLKRKGSGGK